MSNFAEQRTVPRATTRRSRRVSIIWIVPLAAVAIGGWLAWDTLSKEGPTIKISFESGEGLQAGQSQLKYKDIVFGTVKSLELASRQDACHHHRRDDPPGRAAADEGTLFWVVKPRLFAGNISGIETLLSGSYIGMLPAPKAGKSQRDFVGREDPPVLGAYVPGHTFLLKSKRIGAVSVGSPIFFRDLNVGEVLGWDHRRNGGIRDDPRLRPGRPMTAMCTMDAFLERVGSLDQARRNGGRGADGVAEGAAARRRRVRDARSRNPRRRSAGKPRLSAVRRPGDGERGVLYPEDSGNLVFPRLGQRAGSGRRCHGARSQGRRWC